MWTITRREIGGVVLGLSLVCAGTAVRADEPVGIVSFARFVDDLKAPSAAALDLGERAPDFTTAAARDGKVFEYSLAAARQRGPVVLYFFPAAFTPGLPAVPAPPVEKP